MIITCPSCGKRYMLDETLLAPEGRQVRCTACQHVWRYVPDNLPSLRPSPLLALPQGENRIDGRSFTRKKRGWRKWFLVVLMMGIFGFGVFGRHWIVAFLPQTQSFYMQIGLPAFAPGTGLMISNVSVFREGEAEKEIWVEADMTNRSPYVQEVPPLNIVVQGKNMKGVFEETWKHHLAEHILLPGETIHFKAPVVPEGAQRVLIKF